MGNGKWGWPSRVFVPRLSASSRKENSWCVACRAGRKFLRMAESFMLAIVSRSWMRLTIATLVGESSLAMAGMQRGVGEVLGADTDAGLGQYGISCVTTRSLSSGISLVCYSRGSVS